MIHNYNHNSEPTVKDSFETNKIMSLENSGETYPIWQLGKFFDEKDNTFELCKKNESGENKCLYNFIKTLGRGGFGITYLAQDTNDNLVAIKTLKIDVQNNAFFERHKQNFYSSEVMALSNCRHPNIVKNIELIHENGLPCLVMEYVDGKNIFQLVREKGKPLSEREALVYIKQIGEALKEVHARGWLHRDVKPQNIIICRDSKKAVLIDFGIARKYRRNGDIPLTSFKSEGYAPYEQYSNGEKQGFHSDVHALAATLYFMLTNETPKSAPQRREQEKDILEPPKSLNNNVSAAVNNAILQGMARNPRERPQTIEDWLDMLPDYSWREPLVIEATISGGVYGLMTSVFANNLNNLSYLTIWLLGMMCFIIFQSFILPKFLQDRLRQHLGILLLGIAIVLGFQGFQEKPLITALMLMMSVGVSFFLIWLLLDLYSANFQK